MTDLPKIINKKHYNRIKGLIEKETVVIGGGTDDERYFIEPTVLIDVSPGISGYAERGILDRFYL